ncbi:urease accessory protein UreD [Pseudomaricurvus sp. HS19]|uniref:urease accessory protein UreD n=1 Tax=Pseudomaricurvus sp. HS19 TaxID=2692626 RepID=UPI00136A534F|nr:urease accessory protein UreD [Pseudomaricurvus sp. HS19]
MTSSLTLATALDADLSEEAAAAPGSGPTASTPGTAATDWGHWPASLELEFSHGARGSRLTTNRHQGPLYVQKPFYPEGDDLAHAYILHPPGGLVSGDQLRIAVQVHEQARALLTTPGAGRVYRARPDRAWQYQSNHFNVAAGGSLEWLPLETIVYPNARTDLATRIDLEGDATFIGWEVTSLGLPACGADLQDGEVRQRFALYRDGTPLFIERFQLDATTRRLYAARVGMQGNPINGLFVAGPFSNDAQRVAIKSWCTEVNQNLMEAEVPEHESPFLAGVSLVDDCLVGRYLGGCSEQGRKLFTRWWHVVRPQLMQRPACEPRIWLT